MDDQDSDSVGDDEVNCNKCAAIFRQFTTALADDLVIVVGLFSSFSTLMCYISSLQYGVLIFNQAYTDDDASKDYISNRISLALLIT